VYDRDDDLDGYQYPDEDGTGGAAIATAAKKPYFSRKRSSLLEKAIHDCDIEFRYQTHLVDVALEHARLRRAGNAKAMKTLIESVRPERRDDVCQMSDEFLEAAGKGPIERERR
jgi:hypothetical protein